MRQKQLFTTMLACMAFCACTNDESLVPDNPKTFTGDEAYMSVKLADVGSVGTRGTSGNPNFEYGRDEHAVKTAHFYFYDSNKAYVAQGSAWSGGTESTADPAENIEFRGNTVVVLKGLTQKNYPKYMITVLNRPANFTPGQTLSEMEQKLSDEAGVGIMTTESETNYFTMSTTSYKHTDNTPYFVTEVKDENFSLEPIDLDDTNLNPVTVYVERLAAKVSLKVNDDLTNKVTVGEETLYKLPVTLAGEDNIEDNDDIAATDIYVKFLGWKLNATAKHSKMMKNIDEIWADNFGTDGFAWNDFTNFRSYWGKSFNYGDATCTYNGTTDATEPLAYTNLNGTLNVVPSFDYCAENTNISEIVSANFPAAVTSVLLKAQICDEGGVSLGVLIRYNGMLFTEVGFLKYVLNQQKALGQLNYYTKTVEGDATTYTQINETFVKLENVGNGEVKVIFEKPTTADKIYSTNDETGTEVTDFTTLNNNLANASDGAVGFTDGMMYYNIPIEHLNNDAITETDGEKTIPEAKYGVVRNHHYVVSITKLDNLGNGIFNPDEVIVPDEKDQTKYYVGAKINILSWKLVNQEVEL